MGCVTPAPSTRGRPRPHSPLSTPLQLLPPVPGARPQFENNHFTETCSASEAGSYLRLTDFVYHSTLGVRVIKKEKKVNGAGD